MQSGDLADLLEHSAQLFDWIIIDSPPLTPLADTAFWARAAHGTLLVVRQGITERRALQRGLEMIDKACFLGVVVNESANADHKKYYDRYGYGYGSRKDNVSTDT
jgi:Mrp family chromosome partitioning ATPase